MPNTRLVVACGKVSTPETLVWLEPHTLELQHLEPGTALVFVTQSHPGNFAHSSGLGAAGVWGWHFTLELGSQSSQVPRCVKVRRIKETSCQISGGSEGAMELRVSICPAT